MKVSFSSRKMKFVKEYDTYIWKGVEGEYEKVGRPSYDHYVGDVVVFNDENGESGVMLIAGEFEYYGTTEFYTGTMPTETFGTDGTTELGTTEPYTATGTGTATMETATGMRLKS